MMHDRLDRAPHCSAMPYVQGDRVGTSMGNAMLVGIGASVVWKCLLCREIVSREFFLYISAGGACLRCFFL